MAVFYRLGFLISYVNWGFLGASKSLVVLHGNSHVVFAERLKFYVFGLLCALANQLGSLIAVGRWVEGLVSLVGHHYLRGHCGTLCAKEAYHPIYLDIGTSYIGVSFVNSSSVDRLTIKALSSLSLIDEAILQE